MVCLVNMFRVREVPTTAIFSCRPLYALSLVACLYRSKLESSLLSQEYSSLSILLTFLICLSFECSPTLGWSLPVVSGNVIEDQEMFLEMCKFWYDCLPTIFKQIKLVQSNGS
jgi:hypothetical protein